MLLTLHTAAALDLRRRWLVTAPVGCALPANAAEQMMRTSSDIGSYADATGSQRAANLGAGSISARAGPTPASSSRRRPSAVGPSRGASSKIVCKYPLEPGLGA